MKARRRQRISDVSMRTREECDVSGEMRTDKHDKIYGCRRSCHGLDSALIGPVDQYLFEPFFIPQWKFASWSSHSVTSVTLTTETKTRLRLNPHSAFRRQLIPQETSATTEALAQSILALVAKWIGDQAAVDVG